MKKKTAIVIMMILLIAGTLSAQVVQQTVETTTISGKLSILNSLIAVETENQTYYVHGFQHLINFVDGLKEGASVSLEGYVLPYQNDKENLHFVSTNLTLNGKSYDLQTPYGNRGMRFDNDTSPWQNRGDMRMHRNNDSWQRNRDWDHHPRMNRDRINPRMNRGR
jgi:hypothetical protein